MCTVMDNSHCRTEKKVGNKLQSTSSIWVILVAPMKCFQGIGGGGEPKMRREAEIRVREGRGQKRERDFFF